jgi:hypothetical protein
MLHNADEFEPFLRQAQKYAEQEEKAKKAAEESRWMTYENHRRRLNPYDLGDYLRKYPASKFSEIFGYLSGKKFMIRQSDCYGAVIFGFFAMRQEEDCNQRIWDFKKLLKDLFEIPKHRHGVTLKEIVKGHLEAAERFKSNSRFKGQRYYDLLVSLNSLSEREICSQHTNFVRAVREAYETKGHSREFVCVTDMTDGMIITLKDYLKEVTPSKNYTVNYKL